ncbi:E3 ubiquitin-protein ligase UPL4-like [Iris pallida]|uniref:HECT-type E3 ubiquitin transferase n=1 Tax=Iris pallida TaxID=29817 RepID=A0AAX6G8S2_IRIPA|nr:E3 ubiquitin-protein ligase UPL4-like [Iris pallida]
MASSSSDEGSDDGGGSYDGGDGEILSVLPTILPGLSPGADPSKSFAALTGLCDLLVFTEYVEDLRAVPLDGVVPGLVRLLAAGGGAVSNDVMLLSARAMKLFLDLVPASAEAVVRHGGVEALARKMTAIEYLDLAEECLLALEKLSRSKPEACLKAGVIMAVLGFIDFFELSNQRTAVSTAANLCKQIPDNYLSTVIGAVPTLTNLLQYEDRRIVESAAISLMGVSESFSNSSELVDELCKNGVVEKSLKLISSDGLIKLSKDTCTGLLVMLVRLAASSLVAIRTLFEMNVSRILGSILKSCDHSRNTPSLLSDGKYYNQVEVVLKLCNQLIPNVEKSDQDMQLILQKEKIIVEQPMFLDQFAMEIVPVLIKMVNSGGNTNITFGCVSIIENMTYFMAPIMVQESLKKDNMPRFLAGLLSRKDHHVLISTLRIVENLLKKLPEVFLDLFVKEGVIHAICALSELVDHSQPPSSHIGVRENKVSALDISSCLCYAFGSSSCLSSSEVKTCRFKKHTLPTLAKHIKFAFFTSVNSKMGCTETLQKLKTFSTKLETDVNISVADWVREEDHLCHILDQVMKELQRKETMSTFEFIESGIVKAFAHYLSNGKYIQRSLDNYNLDDYCVVVNRLQAFASLLLSGQSLQDIPITSLIQYLQNALSALEHFPVIRSSAYKPKSRHTHIPSRQSTKHPCLKVRFVKEEEENDLCYYDNILTVEFSSSFDAIEESLWPKVNKNKFQMQSLAKGFIHQSRKLITPKNPGELVKQAESRRISASGSNEDDTRTNLIFLLDGKQLDRSMSLYQAILQVKINADPDLMVGRTFWDEVHIVTFRMRKKLKMADLQMSFDTLQSSLSWCKVKLSWQKASFFSSLLLAELPCTLEKSNSSYDILFLLKILEGLNRFSFQVLSYERSNAFAEGRIKNFDDLKVTVTPVAQTEFISSKLTDKLQQQMQDPLALSSATMPSWCRQLMEVCPFLFSFEARWKYFYLDVSVLPRNLVQHSERSGVTVLPRKKLTVDRKNVMGSAAKVMSWRGDKKVLLEIEYKGEVGTGLGPTLEFYTLVSHEFQKVGLGMWRGDQIIFPSNANLNAGGIVNSSDFVIAPYGLFPRPWSKAKKSSNGIKFSRVLETFSLLGELIARAIQDGRILDLPFPKAFYKLMLEKELDIYDIHSFDPELGTILVEFQALANRKRFLESSSGEFSTDVSNLLFRNTRIEDLCIEFSTLPGYPDYTFASRRKSHMVNINNLEGYVSLVVDATVRSGISRQLDAFKSGFNKVFPLKTLQIFSEEELERMLCGEQDAWNLTELVDHINFDHGYSSSSLPAMNFIEIIQEFKCQERRAFLQFLTGSPRLPPGGFAALKPKLTVVCKHCTADVDQELPSAMTCANYLKLPPYTSKEKMMEKMFYAMLEGQGSFHLS